MSKTSEKFHKLHLFLCLLLLVNACAAGQYWQASKVYYTSPVVTYIREAPESESPIVTAVYRGDQVTVLSEARGDWCQVKTAPGGQIGWIRCALLSSGPIQVETYYVQTNDLPLRDAPQEGKLSRQVLQRGDQVRKLDQDGPDWWKILVEKDKSMGWIPAAAVSVRPPAEAPSGDPGKSATRKVAPTQASYPPAAKQTFFVATNRLELHLLPLTSSQVVQVLQFNQKVEKVSQSSSDWLKVKHLETGVQGWTQALYLTEAPAKAPKAVVQEKRKAPQKPKEPKPKKTPVDQPEKIDPEVM